MYLATSMPLGTLDGVGISAMTFELTLAAFRIAAANLTRSVRYPREEFIGKPGTQSI